MKTELKEGKEFVLTKSHYLGILVSWILNLKFCCVSEREASLKMRVQWKNHCTLPNDCE